MRVHMSVCVLSIYVLNIKYNVCIRLDNHLAIHLKLGQRNWRHAYLRPFLKQGGVFEIVAIVIMYFDAKINFSRNVLEVASNK